ncbi:helix-turn-helix domain-containing protein [Streptomyces sp. URMC 123]|uniref:helix-turn-helix domain-containing protein n=1 Tax=Streptomyces sp. URMC 123 TaxID=3423403 RepID=UPI003F1A557F
MTVPCRIAPRTAAFPAGAPSPFIAWADGPRPYGPLGARASTGASADGSTDGPAGASPGPAGTPRPARPARAAHVAEGRPGGRRRALPEGVWACRAFRAPADRPYDGLRLPTCTVTLLLLVEGELRLTGASGRARVTAPGALLVGPHVHAVEGEYDGPAGAPPHGMEVTLAPWFAYTLRGERLDRLADRVVDAADALGGRARRLTERLAAAATGDERLAVLNAALTRWAAAGPAPAPPVIRAWRDLARARGNAPIAELARAVGWSQSQLTRRFREHTGLAPKAAARVLRLQEALGLLASGRTAAEAAAAVGFCDQAHFGRECKVMTGRSPGRFQGRPLPLDRREATAPGG